MVFSSMNSSIISITEELIRIKTTADRPEELTRSVDYIEDFFRGSSLVIKRYESGGKPSIVITTQETLSPDIMLVGHLDVVPAPDELFEPRYEGTKMFGRGVCDMKSECVVMMQMLKDLAEQENPPSIALMLTTDEEIGGLNGVNYLLNEVGYRCQVAIVPDGGQAPDDIVLINKGVLLLHLTSHGKTGHGSRPWLGENAIDKLIAAYQKVREVIPTKATADDYWYLTCNIGVIAGGEAANQIAGEATCDLDIRFTEEASPQELLERVKHAVGDLAQVSVRVSGEMIYTDQEDPFVKTYASCVKEVLGTSASFNKHCGSNDGRFFTSLGIPIIVSRPVSGDQHSPHEWLETQSLPVFEEICRRAVRAFQAST